MGEVDDKAPKVDERSETLVASVPPPPTGPGRLLGLPERWTPLERIGAGGMGDIWRARDELLGREVAVKSLHAGRVNAKLAQRLEREAQAIARLRHPSIVTIHDIGRDDEGRPFLVMELLRGEDLARLLARVGRLPAASAIRTLLPVMDALSVAHAHSVVHRDIKPENIFLARGARGATPKLLDFGIAGLGGGSGLTAEIIGTPEYMAPEQLRFGGDIGAPADQWALAMTLYALVAGAPPYTGDDLADILPQVKDAPLPFPRNGSMPGSLFRILATATRKRPEDRFESVAAFGAALAQWTTERGEPVASPADLPLGAADREATTRPVAGAAPARRVPAVSGVERKPESTPLDIAIRKSLKGE